MLELLESHAIAPRLKDERCAGQPLDVTFAGELTTAQAEAAEAILAHDNGVLSAATAFGKTVVGAWLIAARQVNTLVLVHRRQLMDQWRERLAAFLDLSPAAIGMVGGGRARPTGAIDVAVIQSLNKKGVVADLVADYGQVIVDECHHLSAFSFEQVMRQVKARYVVGLTATPIRRDGHHPIITMQCGAIRYRKDARSQAAARPFDHRVMTKLRPSRCRQRTSARHSGGLLGAGGRPEPQPAHHRRRARRRCGQSFTTCTHGAHRSPRQAGGGARRVDRPRLRDVRRDGRQEAAGDRGGDGGKPPKAARVIVATGRCVGEGFDDARLDTLFLAMPVAWRGALQQYAGRLHRMHTGKAEVVIYDYVDEGVSVLARMYQKRLAGYRAMGYAVAGEPACAEPLIP